MFDGPVEDSETNELREPEIKNEKSPTENKHYVITTVYACKNTDKCIGI